MSMEVLKTENKMGTWPVNKLLLSTALPLILAYLMQALYNMVDSLYVSQLSQSAFNAVSLAYPIQNIMNAIQSGTGLGLIALISKSLGEKNQEKANKIATTGVFLAGCGYIVVLLFGLFGTEFFFRSQTAVPEIIEGGKAYLTICCVFSFGQFGQVVVENLMQATGNSKLSMWTQLTGAVINIILDPILIFGWGPFPEMGIAGAAVATVVGQIAGMILGLILNHHYNHEIHLHFKGFRPNGKTILSIYKIGVPSMLTIGIGSVMTYMMNRLLMVIEVTATAAAVFGAYFKIQSFFNMPVVGLSHGMNPIVGYNLGAKNKQRMLKAYKLTIMYAMIYMFIGTMAFLCVPGLLLKIFKASDLMLQIGEPAFRIISSSFLTTAYCLVTVQFFMACGKSMLSLLISATRQLVFLIPAAYLLGYTLGYEYVWFAIPIGELGSLAMAIYGRVRMQKRLFNHMPDQEPTETAAPAEHIIKESVPGAIITIARQHGSQGKQIGKLVAEKLGIPFYCKELTALAAQEIGFHEEFVSDINEKSPDVFRELYLTSKPVQSAILAQEKIIKYIADRGSCVIVGRAADYVLRDYENVFRIFLHAPESYRIQKVMEMYGDTEKEAEKNIHKSDSARAAYYENISDQKWDHANNYNLALNTSGGIEETAERICQIVRSRDVRTKMSRLQIKE